MTDLDKLEPQSNDLVVVPMGMDISADVPFLVHKMKFLNKPSIIRSGANLMSLENHNSNTFMGWLKSFGGLPFIKLGVDTTDEDSKPDTVFERSIKAISQSEDFTDTVFDALTEKTTDDGVTPKPNVIPTVTELPKFFRYHRGYVVEQHADGEKWEVNPKGGVAFYVELDAASETFAFSYALCHTDDNFCRKIARGICKQRFEHEDWYEIENYDGKLSVVENIKNALALWLPPRKGAILEATETSTRFSSMSDRAKYCEQDLIQIYERI